MPIPGDIVGESPALGHSNVPIRNRHDDLASSPPTSQTTNVGQPERFTISRLRLPSIPGRPRLGQQIRSRCSPEDA